MSGCIIELTLNYHDRRNTMNNYENLYCKIFIDSDKEKDTVTDEICTITSGKKEMFGISTNSMDIDVRRNEDFNETKRAKDQDGFLYSRFYIDVEPKGNIKQDEYISDVSKLLEELWSMEYNAVAACDFEEKLPRKGGYNYGK
jgi:hypothetical protein